MPKHLRQQAARRPSMRVAQHVPQPEWSSTRTQVVVDEPGTIVEEVLQDGEPLANGGTDAPVPFEMLDGTFCENADCGCGPCECGTCGCGPTGGSACGAGGIVVGPGLVLDNLSIFGGVQGFKNAANRGQDGSFGFHEGFNFGTPLGWILPPSFGAQAGLRVVHSNLSGADFSTSERNQLFFTGGIFRRADYGLQTAVAVDLLRDNWYYDIQLSQIRGELSMALNERSSYGFWFAASSSSDSATSELTGPDVVEAWETTDLYAFFFRSRYAANDAGEVQLHAGLTGESDGLIGASSRLPLTGGWALESEFTYLIPDEGTGRGGHENEAWNLAIGLAWYPGSLACGSCSRYHRPVLDVAGNGSMIIRRDD